MLVLVNIALSCQILKQVGKPSSLPDVHVQPRQRKSCYLGIMPGNLSVSHHCFDESSGPNRLHVCLPQLVTSPSTSRQSPFGFFTGRLGNECLGERERVGTPLFVSISLLSQVGLHLPLFSAFLQQSHQWQMMISWCLFRPLSILGRLPVSPEHSQSWDTTTIKTYVPK